MGKYPLIFALRNCLFLKVFSFPRASNLLLESCSLHGTDNARRQISEGIFALKGSKLFIYTNLRWRFNQCTLSSLVPTNESTISRRIFADFIFTFLLINISKTLHREALQWTQTDCTYLKDVGAYCFCASVIIAHANSHASSSMRTGAK